MTYKRPDVRAYLDIIAVMHAMSPYRSLFDDDDVYLLNYKQKVSKKDSSYGPTKKA
jgi:hypothetical protein